MRLAFGLLVTALATPVFASVQVTSAAATDAAGNPIAPRLGEPYYVTVGYTVTNQTAPYSFSFAAPSGTISTCQLSYGLNAPGSYWIRWGTMTALYDGPQQILISTSAGRGETPLTVTPQTATNAIETFNTRALTGSFSMSASFNRAAAKLVTWTPLPMNSPFQTISSISGAPAVTAVATQTEQTIGVQHAADTKQASASLSISVTASSVRVNSSVLRTVPMSAIKSVESANAVWLRSEPQIESTNGQIVSFAKNATKSVRATTSVYDAALDIYSALLLRSSYALTGKTPDALHALVAGSGECGDLSALFVAACRAIGIPARAQSGFYIGDNQWHVWAEFLVPGQGWVPVDPAFALGIQAHAQSPLYFGVIPEMNQRVSVCTGFEQTVEGVTSVFVQRPEVFWFQNGLAATAQTSCHLAPTTGQA